VSTIDKTRVKDLRIQLKGINDELQRITGVFKIEDNGGVVVSPEQRDEFRKHLGKAQEVKALIDMEEGAAGIAAYLDGVDDGGNGPAAGTDATDIVRRGGIPVGGRKSLGEAWLGSEQYKSAKAGRFSRLPDKWESIGDDSPAGFGQKDVYSGTAGTVTIPALGTAVQTPLVERTLRPTRVRDLFPKDSTNAPMLYGVREVGFVNAARPVPQRETETVGGVAVEVFGRKPKSDLQLTTVTYPIATIAHTLDVHKNAMDDEPRLRGILDRDMVDGVKMVEDEQLLYGDGENENITGIFNTEGTQAYAQAERAGDKKSAAIRRAATRAALAYFVPTGVVLHPFDWEDVELEEDGNGSYRISTSVAIGAEKRIWRMDVVDTPAIRQRQFLVGAFGRGAKVYDREQVSVTASSENRDNYERNVVTLRAEERIGMEVPRPESFVEGTFLAA